MRLNPSIKLGFLTITISFTALCATLTAPQTTWAAPVPASKAVYPQFQKYSKNAVTSTPSLIQARKYLLNHINEVDSWQASLMTLQLENSQKSRLADLDQQMYTERFQRILSEAHTRIGYEQKLTYSSLFKVIKDPSVRKLLQEASDLGFKLETSEGLYYSIINYEVYKKFQPYVKPDIIAYIDIMAAESNQPTTSDAAFMITWDELIRRTLEKEAFLNHFPSSNRTAAVNNSLYVSYLFYGSDNSPAYDWYTEEEIRTIDPAVKKAYEKALADRLPDTKSVLLDTVEKILQLLKENHDELTPEIREVIEHVEAQFPDTY